MKLSLLTGIVILFLSIIRNEEITLPYPDYFPKPNYDLSKNHLRSNVVQLGRELFYDPILSLNNSISCASCHSSFNSFAHTDHALSHGIYDSIGLRNAPALFNLAWQQKLMWDGAIVHLDVQALAPITHPKEMGESLNQVIHKLQSSNKYPALFFDCFQDSIITGEHLLKALAQFQLTLISDSSRYDKMRLGQVQFTEQENRGYVLFKQHCNSCHTEPMFTNYEFLNNGLPVDTTLNDYGRYQVTHQAKDSLCFKVPSLRNISFTYPYMHDGRFKKLAEVLRHYTQLIATGSNLDKRLTSKISLSSNDKVDLISFLLTLNDTSFVFRPNYQFPKPLAKDIK